MPQSSAVVTSAEASAAPRTVAAAAEVAVTGGFTMPVQRSRIAMALWTLLLLSLAAQLLGVVHRNVNWDEFLFLSNVYRVSNGHAVGLLQTSYAQLFRWLTGIGGGEIAQITVARALYLAVWTGSLVLLYRLGRRLLDPLGALAAVALFALFSYSLTHAASFRVDGLLLPVLLAVALLLIEPTTVRTAAAGALSGVALALTIKAVLWAPALAGVLAAGLWSARERVGPVLAGAAAAVLTFGAIMLGHHLLLSAGGDPAPPVSAQRLSHTGWRMLLEDGLLPRWEVLVRAVVENPVTWALMAAGLILTLADLGRPERRRRSLLLLALALPVASISFYANAWPYAYLVLIPTACLLAGRAFSHYLAGGRPHRLRSAASILCLAAAAGPMAAAAWSLRYDQQAQQRQVLAIVHGLFDEPVAYIDKGGMVPSFPRQPYFLSRWGLKNYHDRGEPLFSRYVRQAEPPLLIANTPSLQVWDEEMLARLDPRFRLIEEDEAALRQTYAPYWGPIYLAGRQWSGLGAGEEVAFDILIPGEYTLIAGRPARIDGRPVAPGATVSLAAGRHRLATTGPEPDLRLLWGSGTAIPAEAPSPMPLYTGL